MLRLIATGDVLVFIAGVLVGWNLIPQPSWVRNAWSWVWQKVSGKAPPAPPASKG